MEQCKWILAAGAAIMLRLTLCCLLSGLLEFLHPNAANKTKSEAKNNHTLQNNEALPKSLLNYKLKEGELYKMKGKIDGQREDSCLHKLPYIRSV